MFFSCTVQKLPFDNKSSKLASCISYIRCRFRPWSFTTKKIQRKGQYLNAAMIYASDKYFLCSVDKNFLILVKARKRSFTTLQKLLICLLKVSWPSMVISRGLTSQLHRFHRVFRLLFGRPVTYFKFAR